MDRTASSRASRIFFGTVLAAVVLTLAGCDLTVANLTPSTLPANPSQLYTITTRVSTTSRAVVPGSVAPSVIVDGQYEHMTPSSAGGGLWEFDYALPPGRDSFSYYVLVDYKIEGASGEVSQQKYTAVQTVKVTDREVVRLAVTRGPVGSRIGVLGFGFNPGDTVYFGQTPARTVYDSTTSLSFFVPNVAPGTSYDLTLASTSGSSSPIGSFRVDAVALSVSPDSLVLKAGAAQPLTFTLARPAPAGGLLLDVTTDVPESVIMPEVLVPEGQTSVTVKVQGGRPGAGSLFLRGYGNGELAVPITVK